MAKIFDALINGVSYETNVRLCKTKMEVIEWVETILLIICVSLAVGISGTIDYETEMQIPPQESVFASFYNFF